VIAIRVKVSRGIEPFSPMGIDSADTIVNCPMGRFAWTNHIYFQITQPGSSTDFYWGEKRENIVEDDGNDLGEKKTMQFY
jgi:hypothetical protein